LTALRHSIVFWCAAGTVAAVATNAGAYVVDGDPTVLTRLTTMTQLGEAPPPAPDPMIAVDSWPTRALLVEQPLDMALVDVGDGVTALQLPLSSVDLRQDGAGDCELTLDGMPSLRLLDQNLWVGAPWPTIVRNGHHEKNGDWLDYDQIARRWDRPEAYTAYRLPVPPTAYVASGYDLDKPDDQQRRAPNLSAVGHGGVDLADKMGTPVRMVTLDHQVGDAEVLYVGHLFGTSVVTRHTIREAGHKRDYVLIFGHLDAAAEQVWRGRRLHEGELVGYMGNTDSPELVHLHLEARRMRDGVDAWHVPGWSIDAREYSVVSDPRNVLPLRMPLARAKKCSVGLARLSLEGRIGGVQAGDAGGSIETDDASVDWLRPMRLTLDLGAPAP
jgi:hypothetical protein